MPKKPNVTPADLFQELLSEPPIYLTAAELEELSQQMEGISNNSNSDHIPGLVSLGSAILLHGGAGCFVKPDRSIVAHHGTVLRGILLAIDFAIGISVVRPKKGESFEEFRTPVHYAIAHFALTDGFGTSELSYRQGAVVPVMFRDKISGHPGALRKFLSNLGALHASVDDPRQTAAYIWTLTAEKQSAVKDGEPIQWYELGSSVEDGSYEISHDSRKLSVFHYSLLPLCKFLNQGTHNFESGVPGVVSHEEWRHSFDQVSQLLLTGQTLITPGNELKYLPPSPSSTKDLDTLSDQQLVKAADDARADLGM